MKFTKSQITLILASIVTAWLTWHTYEASEPTAIVLPTRVASSDRIAQSDKAELKQISSTLAERPKIALSGDLFPPRKTEPEKTTHMHTPQLPRQVAPPLPFKYLGRWQDNDKRILMIDYQGEVIAIKEGDVVANQYQVMAINESANKIQIQFLMIPFKQIQIMQVGEDSHE